MRAAASRETRLPSLAAEWRFNPLTALLDRRDMHRGLSHGFIAEVQRSGRMGGIGTIVGGSITMPGLDSNVALGLPLCGTRSCWAQNVLLVVEELLQQLEPGHALSLQDEQIGLSVGFSHCCTIKVMPPQGSRVISLRMRGICYLWHQKGLQASTPDSMLDGVLLEPAGWDSQHLIIAHNLSLLVDMDLPAFEHLQLLPARPFCLCPPSCSRLLPVQGCVEGLRQRLYSLPPCMFDDFPLCMAVSG